MSIPNGYTKIEANKLYENVEYYIDTTIPLGESVNSNFLQIYPSLSVVSAYQPGSGYRPSAVINSSSSSRTQITTSSGSWSSYIVDGVYSTYSTLSFQFSFVPDWLYVKAPESKYKAVELYEETELQESAELTIEANTTTTLQLEEGKVAVKSVTITTRVTSGLVTIVQSPEPPTDALKSKLYVENSIYWVGEPTDDATPFIKYIKASDFAGVFADDNYHYLKFDFPTATYYYDYNGYYKGSVGWYKDDEQWVYNSDDLIFNSAMMNTSNDLSYLYTIVGTPDIDLQEGKSVLITQNGVSLVTPDSGYDAFKSLAVSVQVPDVIPEGYIKPTGTLEITENGDYDVTEKASVNVNVPIPEQSGGYTMSLSDDGTEINFVFGGAVKENTFTIDGTSYTVEEGMLWITWVQSDYNTDGYYHQGGYIYNKNGNRYVDGIGSTEEIVIGGAYSTIGESSSN